MNLEANDVAKLIMGLFPLQLAAGEGVPAEKLAVLQAQESLTDAEVQIGLAYATEQEWISTESSGGLVLTEAGRNYNLDSA